MKRSLTKFYKKIRYCKSLQGILQVLAMNAPHDKLSIFFHRLRGVKIGRNVYIDRGVFIETSRPHLVTIKDNVEIGPNAMIIATDSSYNHIFQDIPILYKNVTIEKNVYIGAGAIILPGVTIGESAIIGAGAVVTGDVPSRAVAVGIPARVIKTVDEGSKKFDNLEKIKEEMLKVPKVP